MGIDWKDGKFISKKYPCDYFGNEFIAKAILSWKKRNPDSYTYKYEVSEMAKLMAELLV